MMESHFHLASDLIALALESVSVLLIALGALLALARAVPQLVRGTASHGTLREVWLGLARWLLLGLEFMLAADIVRSAISPNWNDIGQLAAIAVIRTFLNFFLERDLDAASELARERGTAES